MAPTVSDLKQQFMAAQLGIPLSSLQDLEKKFYETYQTGGLSQLASNNIFTGTNQFNGNVGFYGTAPVAKPTALTASAAAAPAGGVGAAAGAWDTAANRDAAIATINNLKTRLDEVETKLKALGLLT